MNTLVKGYDIQKNGQNNDKTTHNRDNQLADCILDELHFPGFVTL